MVQKTQEDLSGVRVGFKLERRQQRRKCKGKTGCGEPNGLHVSGLSRGAPAYLVSDLHPTEQKREKGG